MAETKGRHLLTDKDFREVVDEEGNDLPPVPKHWGEDQLALGASFKRKTARASSSSSSGGSAGGGGQQSGQDAEPKGNASREDWAAYATKKGAPEEETKPVEDGGLSRDDLKAKYGQEQQS